MGQIRLKVGKVTMQIFAHGSNGIKAGIGVGIILCCSLFLSSYRYKKITELKRWQHEAEVCESQLEMSNQRECE